ncbi:MAG: hypothetical protein D6752_05840 [Candidatus Nitrosothermus koennekii]|nr:MAG: hypothetical protein D6752_05840 [Candidatus Nitrosothermus koennekii]
MAISNARAAPDLKDDIKAALIANLVDPTDADNAATAIALALTTAGFSYDAANADMVASISGKDTDADPFLDVFSVLLCISNNGFPVPSLGLKVWCATYTNDDSIDGFDLDVNKPISGLTDISSGAVTPGVAQVFPLTMDERGHWEVMVKYNNGTQLAAELEVSWNVLPEAPIGAIAIIGSSIAVVSLYGLKKKQNI